MKITVKIALALVIFSLHCRLLAQWTPVLDNVTPVDIEISPDYLMDQTVYILDDEEKIWISETGGSVWTTIYDADNPSDPSQAVQEIVLSPNFKTDNAIVRIHKDGTMKISPDRGQHWLTIPAPEGVTDMVFSPFFADDYTMHCITGAFGPVKFYQSVNGGVTWGDPVSDITIGGGYYSKLWNSTDPMAKDTFAVQYENQSLYISYDGGETWQNSFGAQVSVRDFVFSPQFSSDSVAFVADAADIYKNAHGGKELFWENKGTFPGSFGIKFAISPAFGTDQTIFAAVDQVGISRSIDAGETWAPFNEGFTSILPISIAISNALPYTLFAGTMGAGGTPDKVWRYQWYSGTGDEGSMENAWFSCHPNPFKQNARLDFELHQSGHVRISISDMNGRKIMTLLDENLEKGPHSVVLNNTQGLLPSGFYICQIETNGLVGTGKLVVSR